MKNTFKRFNLSDVVFIIGVLAIVCGILFRNPIEKLFTDLFYQKNIEYIISISSEDAKMLSEGTVVTDASGNKFGTVKYIKPGTSAKDINGVVVGYNVTVVAVGMTDKLGTYIGNSQFIAPRMSFEIYAGNSDPISCIVKKVQSDG